MFYNCFFLYSVHVFFFCIRLDTTAIQSSWHRFFQIFYKIFIFSLYWLVVGIFYGQHKANVSLFLEIVFLLFKCWIRRTFNANSKKKNIRNDRINSMEKKNVKWNWNFWHYTLEIALKILTEDWAYLK